MAEEAGAWFTSCRNKLVAWAARLRSARPQPDSADSTPLTSRTVNSPRAPASGSLLHQTPVCSLRRTDPGPPGPPGGQLQAAPHQAAPLPSRLASFRFPHDSLDVLSPSEWLMRLSTEATLLINELSTCYICFFPGLLSLMLLSSMAATSHASGTVSLDRGALERQPSALTGRTEADAPILWPLRAKH